MDINGLKATLLEGVATVNFTKVNGHKRTMVCTLNDSYLPPSKGTSEGVRDENLLVVWDTEHQGWRTIKVDSILEWAPGENTISLPAEETAPPSAVKPVDNIGWTPKTPKSK